MAFSEEVVKQAWIRAGGKCECIKGPHKHLKIACGRALDFEKKGKSGETGCWDIVQIKPADLGGDYSANNSHVICCDCRK